VHINQVSSENRNLDLYVQLMTLWTLNKQSDIHTRRLSVDERLADSWSFWPRDDLLTTTTKVIRVKLLSG
jgi:hypothetical protein